VASRKRCAEHQHDHTQPVAHIVEQVVRAVEQRLGVGSGKFFQLARGGLIFIDLARVRVFLWAKWAGLEWAWPKTRTRVALNYFSE
jgi:hypothetical protein